MRTSPEHASATPAIAHHGVQHLGLTWALALPALLAAWAVALASLVTAARVDAEPGTARLIAALAGASRSGSPSHGTTWVFDLPPPARTAVQLDLAAVEPGTRPLLQRLAGMVSFADHLHLCRPPAASCSAPGSGTDGRWGIHLDADTTAWTYPSNRFLVYHEIGHAEWALLLGPTGRRAFAAAVSRALGGRACINDQGRPCAELPEMFADEFARYVGGFAVSMSYYCTPPLLDAAAFGGLVSMPDLLA